MKTNENRFNELEETLYKLASLYQRQAENACETLDTNAVHWFVTEARKAGNMPRILKLRFGN